MGAPIREQKPFHQHQPVVVGELTMEMQLHLSGNLSIMLSVVKDLGVRGVEMRTGQLEKHPIEPLVVAEYPLGAWKRT